MSLHLFSNYVFAVLFFLTVFVLPKHLTTKLTWDRMNSRTQYFPTLVNKPLWIVCLFICLFFLISWSDKLVEYDRPVERGLLLTVTEVSTTCAVVIFRVKVSCTRQLMVFQTTLTQTIILNPLMKWLLGSNFSQFEVVKLISRPGKIEKLTHGALALRQKDLRDRGCVWSTVSSGEASLVVNKIE